MRKWIVVCRVNVHIEACSPPLPTLEDALVAARALMAQGCEVLRIEGPNGEVTTRREIYVNPPATAA